MASAVGFHAECFVNLFLAMLLYSVALCTYNGSKYIEAQLNSIIQQSVPPSQIIVSDDGSSDDTLDIVESMLSNCKCRYSILINNTNHGVTSNFKNAIDNCDCPIIFTSDQDDVWLTNKAETILTIFEEHSDARLVFSNGELVDKDLKDLGCSLWKSVGITHSMLYQYNWFQYLLRTNLVTGAAMAFRKDFYDSIETIPSVWIHDGWLAWAALATNGLYPCSAKLFLYRQHVDNAIGAPCNVRGKIEKWLSNFEKTTSNRSIRYERFEYVKKCFGKDFSKSQKSELDKCIYFWKTLSETDNYNFFKSVRVMFVFYLQGLYHKYYIGFRGLVRDVFLLFR